MKKATPPWGAGFYCQGVRVDCAPGTEFCCQSLDQCMAHPAEFDGCPRPGD